MELDDRIYIRVTAKLKAQIESAADLTKYSVSQLTRIFWERFLEDQGYLVQCISIKGEADEDTSHQQES